MEELVIRMIEQLPNVCVAILVLYWQRKLIEKLLDVQQQQLDALLDIVRKTCPPTDDPQQ
jgi:hypothetical protein